MKLIEINNEEFVPFNENELAHLSSQFEKRYPNLAHVEIEGVYELDDDELPTGVKNGYVAVCNLDTPEGRRKVRHIKFTCHRGGDRIENLEFLNR